MDILNEQMTEGFQKLFAVAETQSSYSALEEMRRETLQLLAVIQNRQYKLRTDAFSAKSNDGKAI